MTLAFQATQTQQTSPAYLYWIRDYWNTFQLDIAGTWTSGDIKQWWITIPGQIDQLNTSYCNASLTVATASRLPYPLRFKCSLPNN